VFGAVCADVVTGHGLIVFPEKKLLLRRLRTEEERDAYAKRCEVGQRVVVDLDFYDKMTDRERASMALQVKYERIVD
jgi:Trm5-related predicted tRNA methylase